MAHPLGKKPDFSPSVGGAQKIDTAQDTWKLGCAALSGFAKSGALAAITAKAERTTPPTSDESNGSVVFETGGGNFIKMKFWIFGDENCTMLVRCWAWRLLEGVAWIPDLVWAATLTAGTATLSAAGVNAAGASARWVDTVLFSANMADGVSNVQVLGPVDSSSLIPDNTPISMLFDFGGAKYIEVEGTIDGAAGNSTKLGFIWTSL